ncbi:MAG TPA: carotenoid biosynthesis protein [Nitrospira sp.]|nr:carotenoid biosynthesis protein [Nitrospira sp.]
MDLLDLFLKTVLLRPYVFVFLAGLLVTAVQLIGWPRTWRLWLISWLTAFVCEFSSTRTGIPFGWYFYTGSTVGQELYISNIPFMDSISFSFLLYAAYCTALCVLLPRNGTDPASRLQPLRFDLAVRTGWPVLLLASLLFAAIDMVIDPIALRGDRWFLGKLYYYAEDGAHFGVPLSNYAGWTVVGLISLAIYFPLDRRLPPLPARRGASTTNRILLGVGLYYSVLLFNLTVTFWIGEATLGLSGVLMFLPLTILLILRLAAPRKPLVAGNEPAEFV